VDSAEPGSSSPVQDTDDGLASAQSKKKKKKRQSVSFAEPLEEHLGSTLPSTVRGEDDNQVTKDSKDSASEVPQVPQVPPQGDDSVDEQPPQPAAEGPSAQVGVTVPFPDARGMARAGFNMNLQQELAEPPASHSPDQSADREVSPREVVIGQDVQQMPLSDEPLPQSESSKETADESKSRKSMKKE
jgi:hypothetical protein